MPSESLFIPLKTQYYEEFVNGTKTIEYRQHGSRWNAKTCRIGRKVVISKGYGRQCRRTGVVTDFFVRHMDSPSWIECYGKPGEAACITIKLDSEHCCETCGVDTDGPEILCGNCELASEYADLGSENT
jgi:hypothetical protein